MIGRDRPSFLMVAWGEEGRKFARRWPKILEDGMGEIGVVEMGLSVIASFGVPNRERGGDSRERAQRRRGERPRRLWVDQARDRSAVRLP
jgi:hypothetical protein